MCHFFMHAKKVEKKSENNGENLYQPDTLNSFRNTWQRVLSEKGSKVNIKTDPEFERSRKVLASMRKQLTQLGMGNTRRGRGRQTIPNWFLWYDFQINYYSPANNVVESYKLLWTQS